MEELVGKYKLIPITGTSKRFHVFNEACAWPIFICSLISFVRKKNLFFFLIFKKLLLWKNYIYHNPPNFSLRKTGLKCDVRGRQDCNNFNLNNEMALSIC